MSRIGKKPIPLTSGVIAELGKGMLIVKGPKGQLAVPLHDLVKVEVSPSEVLVSVADQNNKLQRSLWGLTRSLIANAVSGVITPFEKKLEIIGVAYRAAISGSTITLSLGFSHPVVVQIPAGITVTIDKNIISISGIDKQVVGEFAANIRSLKKPEPYKGKGIKYSDEVVRRKAGKVMKAVGSK
jgi:large subunit ribosomal protein L6